MASERSSQTLAKFLNDKMQIYCNVFDAKVIIFDHFNTQKEEWTVINNN